MPFSNFELAYVLLEIALVDLTKFSLSNFLLNSVVIPHLSLNTSVIEISFVRNLILEIISNLRIIVLVFVTIIN